MIAIFNDPDDISLFRASIRKNDGSELDFFVSDLTLHEHGKSFFLNLKIEFVKEVSFNGGEMKSIVNLYHENNKNYSIGNCSNLFFAQQHHALIITNDAIIVAIARKYRLEAISTKYLKKTLRLISIKQ